MAHISWSEAAYRGTVRWLLAESTQSRGARQPSQNSGRPNDCPTAIFTIDLPSCDTRPCTRRFLMCNAVVFLGHLTLPKTRPTCTGTREFVTLLSLIEEMIGCLARPDGFELCTTTAPICTDTVVTSHCRH